MGRKNRIVTEAKCMASSELSKNCNWVSNPNVTPRHTQRLVTMLGSHFDLMLQILCSESHLHIHEVGGGRESKFVSQTVSLRQLWKKSCNKLRQRLPACVFIFPAQSIVLGLLNVTRLVNPKPPSSKRHIF